MALVVLLAVLVWWLLLWQQLTVGAHQRSSRAAIAAAALLLFLAAAAAAAGAWALLASACSSLCTTAAMGVTLLQTWTPQPSLWTRPNATTMLLGGRLQVVVVVVASPLQLVPSLPAGVVVVWRLVLMWEAVRGVMAVHMQCTCQ